MNFERKIGRQFKIRTGFCIKWVFFWDKPQQLGHPEFFWDTFWDSSLAQIAYSQTVQGH